MKLFKIIFFFTLFCIFLQHAQNDINLFGQTMDELCPLGEDSGSQKSWKFDMNRLQTSGMPSTGTTRALVIFIKFSDDFFTNSCPGTSTGWNPTTYDTTRPPWTNNFIDSAVQSPQTEGSLSDYFDEFSSGKLRFIGDVYPTNNLVYVPEHIQSYYSLANGRGISFLHEEIFTSLDSVIDYSQYDTNPADGIVDMIIMVYRSLDRAALVGPKPWSGIATLNPNTFFGTGGIDNFPLTFDNGVQITGVPGAFNCNLGSGVILRDSYILNDVRELAAHEIGHHWFGCTHFHTSSHPDGLQGSFGYSNGFGPKSGFDKMLLGWKTPTVVSDTTDLTIQDLNTTHELYRIDIPSSSNFFLLENRQRISSHEQIWTNTCGDPKGVFGSGLLITHASSTSPLHIEAADNNYNYPGDDGDTFKPGNSTQFTPWTTPNTNATNGSFTDIGIMNIRQSNNDIIVNVLLNAPPAAPQNFVITNRTSNGQHPIMQWDANTEPDLDHYAIYRGYQDSKTDPINWNSLPSGTTSSTTWTDPFVTISIGAGSRVNYRVTAVDAASNESDYSNSDYVNSFDVPKAYHEDTETTAALPTQFRLHTNYPNPFNPETQIQFDLPEAAQVSITIYNIAGAEVQTLTNGFLPAGFHNVTWNGKDRLGAEVASGVYIYRLAIRQPASTPNNLTFTQKMMLLR